MAVWFGMHLKKWTTGHNFDQAVTKVPIFTLFPNIMGF